MDSRALRLASETLQMDEELIALAKGPVQKKAKRKKYKPQLAKTDLEEALEQAEAEENKVPDHLWELYSTEKIMSMKPWKQFNDFPHEVFVESPNEEYTYNF